MPTERLGLGGQDQDIQQVKQLMKQIAYLGDSIRGPGLNLLRTGDLFDPSILQIIDGVWGGSRLRREPGWNSDIKVDRLVYDQPDTCFSTVTLPRIIKYRDGNFVQPASGGDYCRGICVSENGQPGLVLLTADTVTDRNKPNSDIEFKAVITEEFPKVARDIPRGKRVEAFHEVLSERTGGEGKATGVLMELAYPKLDIAHWADSGYAVIAQTNGVLKIIDEYTSISQYERVTVLLSQLLGRPYLSDKLRRKVENRLKDYLSRSYEEKYNTDRPDSIGVIGHSGNFFRHIKKATYDLSLYPDWGVATWTDGITILAQFFGVSPVYLVTALNSLMEGGERDSTLNFITGYCASRLDLGGWPRDAEIRNKFDDIAWSLTRSPNFKFSDIPVNTGVELPDTPLMKDTDMDVRELLTQVLEELREEK